MSNDFIRKVFGRGNDSKEVAKKRLKLALIYDKLEISNDILTNLQEDMVKVISRYFEIDKEAFKIDIHHGEDTSALVVSTPIKAAKHSKN